MPKLDIFVPIKSAWLYGVYSIVRVVDHMWRRIVGLPQMRRSMVTPFLFLGGQYTSRGLGSLKKMGVTGIINMRLSPPSMWNYKKDFDYLHLPTTDQQAPSVEHLKKGVRFIQRHEKAGGKVYVHCRHGEGRGPSMILAYLIHTGMTYLDAVTLVRKVRPFILLTRPQIDRLMEFEQRCQKEKKVSRY